MNQAEAKVIDPVLAANVVLDDLHITNPQDLNLLELIAFARGAVVQDERLDGATARLVTNGKRAVIRISRTITNPQRRRFTIAHELGHLEMERWGNALMLCKSEHIVEGKLLHVSKPKEKSANEFAAGLLLPERFFKPLCGQADPSLDFIAELAQKFNVSLTATSLRYTQYCDAPCAIVFSQGEEIKWFQGSPDFESLGLFVDVGNDVHLSTIAASLFQGRRLQSTTRRIKATAWLRPGRYQEDATVLEQSQHMPNLDGVLTLLWVDADMEDAFYE